MKGRGSTLGTPMWSVRANQKPQTDHMILRPDRCPHFDSFICSLIGYGTSYREIVLPEYNGLTIGEQCYAIQKLYAALLTEFRHMHMEGPLL